MQYEELYERSINHKEDFWCEQAAQLNWHTFPQTILSQHEDGYAQWFPDGKLNMCYLCLDRHIEAGRGKDIAIFYDSPFTATSLSISYQQLYKKVSSFAAGLHNLGVGKGDTVLIYMPMIPEAIIAMLACARIGAIHSVVFGGFAPHELALRIDDARPKVVISASYGIEFGKKIPYKILVTEAIAEAKHKTDYQIYYRREEGFDTLAGRNELDFEAFYACGSIAPVIVESGHPLYILYTSGTTGKPKGIVRDTGGYATAMQFSLQYFYDTKPGDVFFAASDIGWVVGHSYIVYAPLLQGCSTVLYEGKPVRSPDAGAFWRIVEQYGVNTLFTAPTAIRAIRKEDPEGTLMQQYDLSSLRRLFLAGERCDPATFDWAAAKLQKPVIDHWWQTESGWPMLGIMAGTQTLPAKTGSAGFPVCGYDIKIVDDEGVEVNAGTQGHIVIRLPLPPGCLTILWNNEARFKNAYLNHFPGYFSTGDGGYKDAAGYFYVMGRTDDVINVSGHRLSTGEMEELIAAHPAVAECAVVGIADELRGQRPVGLIILKNDANVPEEILEEELVQLIRNKIGAIAFFKSAIIVSKLPKTRSGKTLRKTIVEIADGISYNIPSTIEDAAVLPLIEAALRRRHTGLAFS